MSKNYTIPANTDWITLADLMGEDYDSTQYYVIHVNEITNGLLQYTCRLDMPTNEDIGQQFSNFSTIKVGTDVGDYTFLKATDTPIDVEVFVGSEDEPSPTPTPTPTGGIFPKNIAGLVMCLDGEINSRNGVHDESINGMQNLVYAPYAGKSSTTGCLEVLNGTPTFTDKGCKLGGTCFYPSYSHNNLSFEVCLELGDAIVSVGAHWILQNLGRMSSFGGFQILMNSLLREAYLTATDTSGTTTKNIAIPLTSNKVYFAVTSVLNTANSTKMYLNGEEVQPTSYTDGIASALSEVTNVSLGGINSTSTSSSTVTDSNRFPNGGFYCPNDIFYSVRQWDRILTPDEIKQNYLQDKKRFG